MSIYLDHAATSFPKPEVVYRKIDEVLRHVGANPGRSDHKMARKASRVVAETREKIAELFHITDPRQVIFTSNATEAINLGLKGILCPGDHVITSSIEHNSVIRPLRSLERGGISFYKTPCSSEGHLDLKALKRNLKKKTKLIILTHASNVLGTILPVGEVGAFARSKGILFMVDAAQTAGLIPIDVEKMKIDLLACPGHKSLYGPQGTGFLYVQKGIALRPLKEGGTGTESDHEEQPLTMPYRLESGTLNTPGIGGLGAGVSFILKEGVEKIWLKEKRLTRHLLRTSKKIRGVKIYGPAEDEERVPVISFNLESMHPNQVGFLLDDVYDILIRVGLHCAPNVHRIIKAFPAGSVRASLGFLNSEEDIEALLRALRDISRLEN